MSELELTLLILSIIFFLVGSILRLMRKKTKRSEYGRNVVPLLGLKGMVKKEEKK